MADATRGDTPRRCDDASAHGLFLREFLRTPWQIGAVAPSSRQLATAMVEPIPCADTTVVVELGPGTGAITHHIGARMAGRGRQLAIEVNPVLAMRLARLHPGLEVVEADARDLPEILAARGIPHVDVIVSGLPWVGFDSATQQALLTAVRTVMAPDGVFVTFGYGLSRWTRPARRFRHLLGLEFAEVTTGRTIPFNIPPAFVYYARRPVAATDDQSTSMEAAAPDATPEAA